jgi:hypothetical protein
MRKKRRPTLTVDIGTCIGALFDAADAAGGSEQLARQLRVPQPLLEGWMEGLEVPPQSVYQRAVEFLRAAVPAEPSPA